MRRSAIHSPLPSLSDLSDERKVESVCIRVHLWLILLDLFFGPTVYQRLRPDGVSLLGVDFLGEIPIAEPRPQEALRVYNNPRETT